MLPDKTLPKQLGELHQGDMKIAIWRIPEKGLIVQLMMANGRASSFLTIDEYGELLRQVSKTLKPFLWSNSDGSARPTEQTNLATY